MVPVEVDGGSLALNRALGTSAPTEQLESIDGLLSADLKSVRAMLNTTPLDGAIANEMMDRRLVEYASKAMAAKLARSRQKGRGGWWDPKDMSVDALRKMLVEHVAKGDMRDVMILAAMVWARETAG